jgi:hypothetical protein
VCYMAESPPDLDRMALATRMASSIWPRGRSAATREPGPTRWSSST